MSERHPTPAPPESCPNPYDHSARAPILVAKWDPLNCYGIAQAARLACPDSAVFECHSAIIARTWLQQRTFAFRIFGLTSRTRNNGVACTTGYDTTSQLTSANYGTGSPLAKAASPVSRETFAYDALGNRTSTSTVGGAPSPRVSSYTSNTLNQYTQVAGVAFAYDANGNLTNDGKQTYRYDAQNRLLAVEPIAPATGAVRAEFAYDNRNRAVARTYWTLGKAGAWVLNQDDSRALTYDTAWNLLAERTRNGAQVGEYIHGQRTDEVLRAELKTYNLPLTACYPMPDGLGSVVALANDSGKVAERFRYSAYGQPTSISPSYQAVASLVSNYRFLFTGREWLAPVSLNEHRNRYYGADKGRWISPDPIKHRGGANFYGYSNGRPQDYTDPLGLATTGGMVQDPINTIVCDGNGGIKIHLGDIQEGSLDESRNCINQHEQTHKDQALAESPSVCSGMAENTQVVFSSSIIKEYEYRAYEVQIDCIKDALNNTPLNLSTCGKRDSLKQEIIILKNEQNRNK